MLYLSFPDLLIYLIKLLVIVVTVEAVLIDQVWY